MLVFLCLSLSFTRINKISPKRLIYHPIAVIISQPNSKPRLLASYSTIILCIEVIFTFDSIIDMLDRLSKMNPWYNSFLFITIAQTIFVNFKRSLFKWDRIAVSSYHEKSPLWQMQNAAIPQLCFLSQITDIRSKRVNSIYRLWKYSFSIKPNKDTITKTFDNICSFLHSEVDTPLLCTMWLVNHFPSGSSPSSVMHTPPSPCLSLFLCLDRSLSSSHINEYSTRPVTT